MTKTATKILICLASLLAGACSPKEDLYLVRETDSINFASCVASVRKISLRCNGNWSAVVPEEYGWISVWPESGRGDGSFSFVEVRVDNNRGLARNGSFHFECDGRQYAVTVSQAEGKILWKTPELNGNLVVSNASAASIRLGYDRAFGDEEVEVTCSMTGACAGLSIEAQTFHLGEGEGILSIPVNGTPTASGYADIDVKVDGSSAGSIHAKVYSMDELPLEGLPVQWNFCDVQGTNADRDALKARQPDWEKTHVLNADQGSAVIEIVEDASKTATAVNSFAYNNGHAYFKGLYVDDAIVMTIPVKNLKTTTSITVSGSVGGSGSSPAFLVLEYSTDGTSWTMADGATDRTELEKDFKYHAQVFDSYLASDGAFNCTFTPGSAMLSGYLQIRLRVCVNIRVSLSSTITTGGGGSTRLKGTFKVTASE